MHSKHHRPPKKTHNSLTARSSQLPLGADTALTLTRITGSGVHSRVRTQFLHSMNTICDSLWFGFFSFLSLSFFFKLGEISSCLNINCEETMASF